MLVTGNGPLVGQNSRLVFASELVAGEQVATLIPKMIPGSVIAALIGWKELPWLFAFDTWVANVDRHQGNILVRSAKEFCAIDHGHCFAGPKTNMDSLNPRESFRNRLAEWLVPEMSPDAKLQFLGALVNLPVQMQHLNISEVLEESQAFSVDPTLSRTKVRDFLEDRRNRLPELGHAAIGRK